MRRLAPLTSLFLLLFATTDAASEPTVRLVEYASTVNPVSALRIYQAIDDAEREGDALVLIELDTPGGLVSTMDELVKRMLSAEVPIVVWVGPSGARAASAGFFLLIAADVAVMAPGTRTGAASTVMLGGENREGDVMLKKANEDSAALARSIAERRGRDVAASEEAIFEARAYEETVALERGLIDFIAADREELLAALDGREVRRFDGTPVVLELDGARLVTSEFPLRQELMELLASPIVAYLLFLGGLLGLYVEFTHPGLVFPGVAGALCLLLFFLASQALPVSAVGVLLILLGIVMFVLEVKVVSFGMLTVGGILSLTIGSLMLIDGPIPELRVPWPLVLPVSIVFGLFCALVLAYVVRARRHRVGTGVEGLSGHLATVTEPLEPAGKVFVQGAIWDAESASGPVQRGERVRILRVDRMRLTVERTTDRRPQEPA